MGWFRRSKSRTKATKPKHYDYVGRAWPDLQELKQLELPPWYYIYLDDDDNLWALPRFYGPNFWPLRVVRVVRCGCSNEYEYCIVGKALHTPLLIDWRLV